MANAKLVFITGGVRSGKSAFAEWFATKSVSHVTNGELHYIACGRQTDAEMAERIRRHQMDRQNNLFPWETWECATQLEQVADQFTKNDIILIDCLTTLLSNEMFVHFETEAFRNTEIQNNLKQSILCGIETIRKKAAIVIVVSNELLQEPLSEYLFTSTYAKLLGHMHQVIVKMADEAYLVEMGMPIVMKGDRQDE